MLDKLVPQVNFAPPLADFLYREPYRSVRGNIQYGFDLGLNDVNGTSCRTLAFVEKDIDWQIWIEDGPQLIPCKLVITYKTQPAQPQFSCGVHRLGLRAAHRRAGVHAGAAAGDGEDPVRDRHRQQVAVGRVSMIKRFMDRRS